MIFEQLEIVDLEHQHRPKYKLRKFVSSYNSIIHNQNNTIKLTITKKLMYNLKYIYIYIYIYNKLKIKVNYTFPTCG